MTTADFRPTHVVPQDGLPAWEAPDVDRPTAPLDALLPVRLVDRLGDWGRIVCANGWTAWVDGRLLIAVPRDPPGASGPLTRTADPRPLLARTEEAVAAYRRAAQDLAGGSVDGETFRRRTRGLRVGVVVDGESLWLYDAEHERWVYCDGTRLSTYAAGEGPSAEGEGSGVADGEEVAAGAGRGAGTEPGFRSGPKSGSRAGVSSPDAEPTAVVPVVPGGADGVGGGAGPVGPEPTRVVESGVSVSDAEPTAVVPVVPGGADGVGGEAGAGPGETRVVAAEGEPDTDPPLRPGED
ncbi:hypothetical protein ABZ726_04850 [Streptomyces hundungensis]|uniref:hypothetical protein n=1 Tax=Streptomyces hundungensis TaxID=1077946 RepID=UPI0033E8B248